MEPKIEANRNSNIELFRAQTELYNHVFAYLKSMSLKCAVELGIPVAIHRLGDKATLPNLLSELSLRPARLPHLRRLMRTLTVSGILAITQRQYGTEHDEVMYRLTPASLLLVEGCNDNANLSPLVLTALDPFIVNPSLLHMSEWFRSDEAWLNPLEMLHGCDVWMAIGRNAIFNTVFNNGMEAESRFLIDMITNERGDVFHGIKSMVDVGGGIGVTARAIAKKFRGVKCTVLDLPQVVDQASKDGVVEFVSGDMFEHIPSADAVFLMSIFHDWGDEACVKILKRCKEAVPPREAGGKVIIVDMVVGFGADDIMSKETQSFFDVLMMSVMGGLEREEHEWKKIFVEAGFNEYKIIPVLGIRSIIEVYP